MAMPVNRSPAQTAPRWFQANLENAALSDYRFPRVSRSVETHSQGITVFTCADCRTERGKGQAPGGAMALSSILDMRKFSLPDSDLRSTYSEQSIDPPANASIMPNEVQAWPSAWSPTSTQPWLDAEQMYLQHPRTASFLTATDDRAFRAGQRRRSSYGIAPSAIYFPQALDVDDAAFEALFSSPVKRSSRSPQSSPESAARTSVDGQLRTRSPLEPHRLHGQHDRASEMDSATSRYMSASDQISPSQLRALSGDHASARASRIIISAFDHPSTFMLDAPQSAIPRKSSALHPKSATTVAIGLKNKALRKRVSFALDADPEDATGEDRIDASELLFGAEDDVVSGLTSGPAEDGDMDYDEAIDDDDYGDSGKSRTKTSTKRQPRRSKKIKNDNDRRRRRSAR